MFLLFLPPVLNALQLPGIEEPVRTLITKILAFIPNLVAAAIIIGIGWFVARLVGRIVANLLAAAGVNRLGERLGMTGTQRLSDMLGLRVTRSADATTPSELAGYGVLRRSCCLA